MRAELIHRVAQIPTAALSIACLHHHNACPGAGALKYSDKPPAKAPVLFARRYGMKNDRAVQDMYVTLPLRS
jgi:hypothetical protein